MVELKEGEELALSLMEEHGLLEKGWTFRFDKATSRLGACHYHKKEISLSRLMVLYAEREDVEQTMLHEIAHALLPPEVGHYKPWKVLAASIGYTGERTGRNPYVEAQLAGLADGPIARKQQKAYEEYLVRSKQEFEARKRQHAKDRFKLRLPTWMPKVAANPAVETKKVRIDIGSTLRLPGGDVGKIESKGRNVWRVRSTNNGKLYAVPFQHAQMVAV